MDPKEIGNRLRALREELGQTKRFVAKATGCSYTSICSYEYGCRVPNDATKVRLANYFKRSVGEIFYADGNHESCSGNQKGR